MKFISTLSPAEVVTLQCMTRNHPLAWVRIRASAVLLSQNKLSMQCIASVFGVCRQTVSIWLENWETKGICGLFDRTGRGRSPTFSAHEESEIIEQVKASPRSLNRVLAEIEKRYGIKICKETLKRLCKKSGLSWKRVRKSLKRKRNDEAFYAALEEIRGLLKLADEGKIDLYFFDESGFTLEPCVPYAWQPKNETIEIPSSHSKRLNVLGFMSHACHFESYVIEGAVNSDVVIACFNGFTKTITKKTVVIIDNASMHTSKQFLNNIDNWKSKGLIIQNIPPYSPELNRIEILWRKIKYEWLDFSAYESFPSLRETLNDILANIGQKYNISFA